MLGERQCRAKPGYSFGNGSNRCVPRDNWEQETRGRGRNIAGKAALGLW